MIVVRVVRDPSSDIAEFAVKGHAGLAKAGQDILCAAVSILTQNAINGIEALVGIEPDSAVSDGLLCFRSPSDASKEQREKMQLLLSSMMLGLQALEEQYPSHMRIVDICSADD